MSDLISRQELLRQADYMGSEHTRYVIRGIATMLPSTQQWIPVSDRLPEEKKEVLVCDKDEFLYIGEYEVYADGVGRWSESVEYRFITDVTAWMPLPEPWRG